MCSNEAELTSKTVKRFTWKFPSWWFSEVWMRADFVLQFVDGQLNSLREFLSFGQNSVHFLCMTLIMLFIPTSMQIADRLNCLFYISAVLKNVRSVLSNWEKKGPLGKMDSIHKFFSAFIFPKDRLMHCTKTTQKSIFGILSSFVF
jgi:hypothetical protein